MNNKDRLLNLSRVSEILGYHRSTIYRKIEAGQLQAVRLGEREGLRVRESELQRYIAVGEMRETREGL